MFGYLVRGRRGLHPGRTSMQEDSFVGLGPMELTEEDYVANQDEVIAGVERALHAFVREAEGGADYDIAHPYNVMTIDGSRGSGKTSVLLTATNQLPESLEEDLIITHPLRPDEFAHQIPPLMYFIREIERKAKATDPSLESEFRESLRFPRKVLGALAASGLEVTVRASANAVDLAQRILDLAENTALPEEFHGWVEDVLEATDKKAVVIPIDDADIGIEESERIVEAIRVFFAHPRIVSIIAVDLPELERRIRNKRLTTLPEPPEYRDEDDDSSPHGFLGGLSAQQFHSAEARREQRYVEALLAKVLPPAGRFSLRNLPLDERLDATLPTAFGHSESIMDALERGDKADHSPHAVDLGPLFERHPEVVSGNIRQLVNQLLMVSSRSSRYEDSLDQPPSAEPGSLEGQQIGLEMDAVTGVHDDLLVQDPEDYRRGRYHMDILRTFMQFRSDLQAAWAEVYRKEGLDPTRIDTLNEFVSFLLKRAKYRGTQYNRMLYRLASREFEGESSALLDLSFDWALARGVPLSLLLEDLGVNDSARMEPTALARKLMRKVQEDELVDLDPNLKLSKSGAGKNVGSWLVVPVEGDSLVPLFLESVSEAATYFHTSNHRADREVWSRAGSFHLQSIHREDEEYEPRKSELVDSLLCAFGILTSKAMHHSDAVFLLLSYEPTYGTKTNLRTEFNHSHAWCMIRCEGWFEEFVRLVSSDDISLGRRIAALLYLSDLPLRLALQASTDPDPGEGAGAALEALTAFIDDLTESGIVNDRTLETSKPGRLSLDALREADPEVDRLWNNFPFVNPEAKWHDISKLFDTLEYTSQYPPRKRVGRLEAPPRWRTWATDCIRMR